MKRALQKGFTLIELVVVIVLLGILAAIAVPQFTDLSVDARLAVGQGACGALQSSATLLYASKKAASTAPQIAANVIVTGGSFTTQTCAASVFTPTGGLNPSTCASMPAALCQ